MSGVKKLGIVMAILVLAGLSAGWAIDSAAAAKTAPVRLIPESFSDLAKRAQPGVVNIRTVTTVKGGGRVFRHFFGNPFGNREPRDPFRDFFGPFSEDEPSREFKQRSLGSGFIIDDKGYIVTNNHVIDKADEIKVRLYNDKEYDAKVVGTDPFAGFEQLKFRYANTDYTHTEFEGDEIGTVFDSDTDDVRLELRHNPWGWWSGAFGLQYTDVDFGAEGDEAFVPPSNTETGALFWIESAEFDQWQLDLGLRYENIDVTALELLEHGHGDATEKHDGHEAESAKRTFKPFSISAGAIWHVTDSGHLTLNLSRAERAPTAQELFSLGPHVASQTFEIGNSQLNKESNLHLEAGYRIHGERLSASFILYADWFDDYIYQQNTGNEEDGFPVRLWSQQDADFVGAEVEVRYDIGHYDSGHWWVFGLFDTVDGELDDGQNVPLMPPTRFGLGLDWHHGGWTANVTWIRADDHSDVADYETPTPGYDLLNADLTWQLPWAERSTWELFLRGRNLLDEDIRNSTSYLKDQAPQIGRNFVFGVRAQF